MKKLFAILVFIISNSSLWAQVGVGTLTPDVNVALDVNGKVKISGAGQTTKQGKVLTSDANGIASWEGAVAFAADGAATDNLNLSGGLFTKVLFEAENYDLSNNLSGSTFTVPTHGIYQINSSVSWIALTGFFRVNAMLQLIRNGVETTISQHSVYVETELVASNLINTEYELQPGDKLYVRILHSNNTSKSVLTDKGLCRFSGRMVIKL